MASFYNPYAYYPYQPMLQTPSQVYQPTPSYQSTQVQSNSIIWVSGPQEAQMYPIAPNNAVALWEKNGKTIYLKSADATGKPTITVYDLVERTQEAPEGEDGKVPTYATKDELGAVLGAVKGFDGELENLKADIATLKGDMYGIAGKKKTAKRVESDDDE